MIFLVILGITYFYRDSINLERINGLVEQAGYLAPVFFGLMYIVFTIVMLPVVLLTIAGGAIFGPYLGALYVLCSATLAATASLLMSRYLIYDWVRQASGGIVARLIRGVEQEGWQFVAFVRLFPLFPFVIANYAFGLTRISVLSYTLTNFIFMAPGTFAFCYLGYLGRSAARDNAQLVVGKVLIGLAIFAVTMLIGKFFVHYRSKQLKLKKQKAKKACE